MTAPLDVTVGALLILLRTTASHQITMPKTKTVMRMLPMLFIKATRAVDCDVWDALGAMRAASSGTTSPISPLVTECPEAEPQLKSVNAPRAAVPAAPDQRQQRRRFSTGSVLRLPALRHCARRRRP